jgi:hypothetical protein
VEFPAPAFKRKIDMAGISDLKVLLRSMKPKLIDDEFVFCTMHEKRFSELKIKPLLVFKEKEGTTLVLEKEIADANSLPYSGSWALITLTVHSDLQAVGFLAKITEKLAENGISVNVVSAYYHDHLFVPFGKAEKTIQILEELSKL